MKGSLQTPSGGSFSYGFGVLDIVADTAGAPYVRWGVSYKYTSGQCPASGNVELGAAYTRCGEMSVAGTWQFASTTTVMQYLAISNLLAAALGTRRS